MLIDTKKGRLNSRFVKLLRSRKNPGADQKPRWTDFAVDAEGTEYEIHGRSPEAAFEPIAQVIPAIQQMTLLVMVADEHNEIHEYRYPIVGWRVAVDDFPEPIAPGCQVGESSADNWASFIELPAGGYQEAGYEGPHFAAIEECRDWLRERADRRQAE
jgi:hypothetical protein